MEDYPVEEQTGPVMFLMMGNASDFAWPRKSSVLRLSCGHQPPPEQLNLQPLHRAFHADLDLPDELGFATRMNFRSAT